MSKRYYKQRAITSAGYATAYNALYNYSHGWRTLFNPGRRAIRQALSQIEKGTDNNIIISRVIDDLPANTSSTNKLAAVFSVIRENENALSDQTIHKLNTITQLGKEQREATVLRLLRSYSAPWLVRLFTGNLGNPCVRIVRRFLRDYDAISCMHSQDYEGLINRLKGLDTVENDPLQGLVAQIDSINEREEQERRDAEEREREEQERRDAEEREQEERERLEAEERQREEQERREAEERQREEQERREVEQREREEREQREVEKREREEKERLEVEKREREEREQRETEKREREEKERLEAEKRERVRRAALERAAKKAAEEKQRLDAEKLTVFKAYEQTYNENGTIIRVLKKIIDKPYQLLGISKEKYDEILNERQAFEKVCDELRGFKKMRIEELREAKINFEKILEKIINFDLKSVDSKYATNINKVDDLCRGIERQMRVLGNIEKINLGAEHDVEKLLSESKELKGHLEVFNDQDASKIDSNFNVDQLIAQAESLKERIEAYVEKVEKHKARYRTVNNDLKAYAQIVSDSKSLAKLVPHVEKEVLEDVMSKRKELIEEYNEQVNHATLSIDELNAKEELISKCIRFFVKSISKLPELFEHFWVVKALSNEIMKDKDGWSEKYIITPLFADCYNVANITRRLNEYAIGAGVLFNKDMDILNGGYFGLGADDDSSSDSGLEPAYMYVYVDRGKTSEEKEGKRDEEQEELRKQKQQRAKKMLPYLLKKVKAKVLELVHQDSRHWNIQYSEYQLKDKLDDLLRERRSLSSITRLAEKVVEELNVQYEKEEKKEVRYAFNYA